MSADRDDEFDLYGDDLYANDGGLEGELVDDEEAKEEGAVANALKEPADSSSSQHESQSHQSGSNAYSGSTSGAPANQQSSSAGGPGPSSGYGQQETSGLSSYQETRRPAPADDNDEGKMFVGGLNWDTTDETLQKYFSQFGKIVSCTIMRDQLGRSRGFAFLTFENPASVNSVMVKEHIVDGKIIDPKRAIPRAEHAKSSKIFVGGLAGTVSNQGLRDFFSQYGNVLDAHVMLDRETNRSKGFGFVTFDDSSAVDRCLAAPALEIDGKAISVAERIEAKKGQPPPRGMGGNRPFQEDANAPRRNPAYPAATGTNATGTGMGGGFDPQAMAMMYQKMMMRNMGMMNPMMGMMNPAMMGGMSPATGGAGSPNAAASGATSPQGQQGGMGRGQMGMPGMMGMGGMPMTGVFNPMMMANMGMAGAGGMAGRGNYNAPYGSNTGSSSPQQGGNGASTIAAPHNAPRGPAAMRNPAQGAGAGASSGAGSTTSGGEAPAGPGQPARYTTQGQARTRPY